MTSPSSAAKASNEYSASDIEVLEGLEPVRRRPGMYIGGTDTKALHHLFAEIIDNSMDEAIAGHAQWIEVQLAADGRLSVKDNGRGIPVEPHPKFKDRSTLEIVMTTLHAGGKFNSKAYETSGGLHGVGISVVNALSERVDVEVARERQLYRQSFERGVAVGPIENLGMVKNRRGTKVSFIPDKQIFGANAKFNPKRLYDMARAKAYLFAGVQIRWLCDASLIQEKDGIEAKATFHYPNGLGDHLATYMTAPDMIVDDIFTGQSGQTGKHGRIEWAIGWQLGDPMLRSYCNTVPTGDGGTHEHGLRYALVKGLKAYGEMVGNKKATSITADDVLTNARALLSVYVREPEFVGQTKDKLSTTEATRLVENAIKDAFDHWLTSSPNRAGKLLDWVVERAEERLRRRKEKEIDRKSATRRLRLPGKLADCSQGATEGAELFIVEGDSAGGSAKQARNRKTQAVLPLRGKILNVAGASRDKLAANQQIGDLIQALGSGAGTRYQEQDLRYEKIIIMTDADVDGAHIASLLMTFFFLQMPQLIKNNHLYLAVPPLYKLSQGGTTHYAKDDDHKDELLAKIFKGKGKIEVSRFKGLGEMMASQLKETTMDPKTRTLLKVGVKDDVFVQTGESIERLMGNKPEARFEFIQERAAFVENLDI